MLFWGNWFYFNEIVLIVVYVVNLWGSFFEGIGCKIEGNLIFDWFMLEEINVGGFDGIFE